MMNFASKMQERSSIARALTVEEFGAGEAIVRQGDPGDTLYMIELGSAAVQVNFVFKSPPTR